MARWLAACENDPGAWQRVRPFAGLVRLEQTGWLVLFPKGSLYVTEGTDRRASGSRKPHGGGRQSRYRVGVTEGLRPCRCRLQSPPPCLDTLRGAGRIENGRKTPDNSGLSRQWLLLYVGKSGSISYVEKPVRPKKRTVQASIRLVRVDLTR